MSSFQVSGSINSFLVKESAKGEFEWQIPNVLSRDFFKNTSFDSPSFYFLNTEWCLRIITATNHGNLWFSLHLVARNPSLQYSVTFTLDIMGLRVLHRFGPETHTFDKTNTSCGTNKFKRCDLMELRLDPWDDSLVVYCEVTAEAKSCLPSNLIQKTLFSSAAALCCNIQDLLINGRRSDVTISVRSQKFKAHKLILEARSPVFAAMFKHDMAEKKENVIKIKDCNPDVFLNFLQCVYGGSLENATVDKAIRLYIVSHKYDVTDIMIKCARFLEVELNEDTVCDILALAKRYDERDLKKSAEDFMALNMQKIVTTNSWSKLINENSLLDQYS